jgi:predicted transcriptional regulator
MEKLTRLEEEIMLIVWKLEQAFVKDIIDEMPEPKPHYNTVSTMMKLLQEKQFVSYTAYGKTYQYYPLIMKENYCSAQVKPMLKNYFEGSTKNLVSFFVKEKNISVGELEKLVAELKDQKSKR